MKLLDKFYNWLSKDYEPLDGRIRFLLYSYLLYLAYPVFFVKIPTLYSLSPQIFYEPEGVIKLLLGTSHSFEIVKDFLWHSRFVLVIAWIMAAIGFGGRMPFMITGLLVFLYWGFFKSLSGTNHTWHLPMYALFIYGFFLKPDKYSLDNFFSKHFKRYPFKPKPLNENSGIGTKLVLIASMYTLFAGGIAKIIHGGFDWVTGETLYFYLENFSNPKGYVGYRLLELLSENKVLVTVLSVWTIILEVGSVFILFFPRIRLFFFINAWLFHLGIYALMLPIYFPQMTIYLFLIDWKRIQIKRPINLKNILNSIFYLKPNTNIKIEHNILQKFLLTFFGLAFIITLAITMLLQEEHYPLTHIPMYSNYADKNRLGSVSFEDLNNCEGLKQTANKYLKKKNPWYLKFHLPQKFSVVKELNDLQKTDYTKEFYSYKNKYVTQNFVWHKHLTKRFLTDIFENECDDIMMCKFEKTSELFQRACDYTFKDQIDVHKVYLIYNMNDSTPIIVSTFDNSKLLNK